MANQLYAGFSRVNITPMLGIGLAGYCQEREADSVLDELENEAQEPAIDEVIGEEEGSEEALEDDVEETEEPLEDTEPVKEKAKAYSCGQLHAEIVAHPTWRVVKGLKGNNDACCPLRFDYTDGAMRFEVDLASTTFHHHAMCEDILDIMGESIADESFDIPVVFKDINREWEEAVPFVRLTKDASVKWLKLYIDE